MGSAATAVWQGLTATVKTTPPASPVRRQKTEGKAQSTAVNDEDDDANLMASGDADSFDEEGVESAGMEEDEIGVRTRVRSKLASKLDGGLSDITRSVLCRHELCANDKNSYVTHRTLNHLPRIKSNLRPRLHLRPRHAVLMVAGR